MKKRKVAVGSIILALVGFAAGSAYAQQQQQQEQCETCSIGPDGECSQPTTPPPVCKVPECPPEGCYPKIQAGECWSQCIHPGQFKTVCNKVETGTSCPEPRVEQDGEKTVSVTKTVREKCYGLKRTVQCKEKRVGWTYKLVKEPETKTITYLTCEEQEVPAAYQPRTETMKVGYEEPYGRPHPEGKTKIKVQVKSEWDHLYRKKSTCWDCTDVCRETEGPEYDWITGYTCSGKNQQCSFDYKKKHTTCSYDVEQCVAPQLPPASEACTKHTVEVTTAPVYEKVPVIVEVCTHNKVRKTHVPAETATVDCQVPAFKELCDGGQATTQCVSQQVQVCEPFLEWHREWHCDYSQATQDVRRVQIALQQEGFDPGPVDGVMGEQTRQAVRAFQQARGLAVGGTLTQETVQALGVQE